MNTRIVSFRIPTEAEAHYMLFLLEAEAVASTYKEKGIVHLIEK